MRTFVINKIEGVDEGWEVEDEEATPRVSSLGNARRSLTMATTAHIRRASFDPKRE